MVRAYFVERDNRSQRYLVILRYSKDFREKMETPWEKLAENKDAEIILESSTEDGKVVSTEW
jgi:hypothetical protein